MSIDISIVDRNGELNPTGKNFKFMIFNLPREKTCVEATEQCKDNCYEKKSCRGNVVRAREKNLEASRNELFIETIKSNIGENINDRKLTYFRIHASGDFYNIEYLDKWVKIANDYVGKNIKFVAYTKSINILDKYLKDNGININDINIKFIYSIMEDTKVEDIQLARNYNLMTYSALDISSVNGENYSKFCTMGCADCMYCYDNVIGNVITNLRQ